jgi:hypothetical protein
VPPPDHGSRSPTICAADHAPRRSSGCNGGAYRADVAVEGAMQTPDGAWRIETVDQSHRYWYRVLHDGEVFEPLSVADVDRVLTDAGVDPANLVPIQPDD